MLLNRQARFTCQLRSLAEICEVSALRISMSHVGLQNWFNVAAMTPVPPRKNRVYDTRQNALSFLDQTSHFLHLGQTTEVGSHF